MKSPINQKTVAVAVGSLLIGSVAGISTASADSPFAMKSLESGYMVAMEEGKCGGEKAKAMEEGKCGGEKAKAMEEGKCGGEKAKAMGDKTKMMKEGKCGEAKCGASK